MDKSSVIYIADHESFVGGAINSLLKRSGYKRIITRTKKELGLMDGKAVSGFFSRFRPRYVFLVAQRSGSIMANIKHPAEFIRDNVIIQTNVIHNAAKYGAKKLLLFGASCMYPKDARQPIKEDSFLRGEVEETSEAYAIAKIAGVETCRAYRREYGLDYVALIPATIYGPGAGFDPESSHVLTALIGKFHEARVKNANKVVLWGSGRPKREFIYVDDLAEAAVFLMRQSKELDIVNVGSGEEIAIKNLALIVKRESGFKGNVLFDRSKPDGVMRKVLNSEKLRRLGWRPKVKLVSGVKKAYKWYKSVK